MTLIKNQMTKIKVTNARRNSYSIKKISEIYKISYSRVLDILKDTQVDAEDKEIDEYIEQTMKTLPN